MITASVSASTALQCSVSAVGSMIIPTDTKKIAANMSRTGRTRFSISICCPDSATSDPAMKAPSATEYPNESASSAAAKQIPMLATSVVSGCPRRRTARIARGTVRRPNPMSAVRNIASLMAVRRISVGDTAPDREIVVRIVRRKIAIRSSMMSIPNTSSVTRPFTFCSWNAFTMIVVLEIPVIAPAKMLSIRVNPSTWPRR